MNGTRNLFPVLALSAVILMGGGWWLGRNSVLPQEPPTPSPSTSGNTTSAIASTPGGQKLEAGMMVVALRGGLMRGNEEESKPLLIPPEVRQVRLAARVEVNYPRYEAVLQTAENKRIWSQRDSEAQTFPDGKKILLDLSSDLLRPGDYILTVRGLPTAGRPETVAEYSFRVGSITVQPGLTATKTSGR